MRIRGLVVGELTGPQFSARSIEMENQIGSSKFYKSSRVDFCPIHAGIYLRSAIICTEKTQDGLLLSSIHRFDTHLQQAFFGL